MLGVVATVAAVLNANAGQQSLDVTMRHGAPRVQRQGSYVPASPIGVTVHAPHADAITLVGVSPAGQNLRVPLARDPNGEYVTTLHLTTPGIWSLAVVSQLGALRNTTENFAIDVTQSDSRLAAAIASGATFLSLAGGLVLIGWGVRRLRVPRAPV